MPILQHIRRFMQVVVPRGMTNKLFAAICAIGIFLVFSLGFIVTSISGNLLYQDAKILLNNQAKQAVNVFDQYMDILKNTVMTASRQSSIQSLIHRDYSGYGSYVVYRDAYAYLKNVHEFYDWIHIYIVVKDINYIMSSNPDDVTGDYRKKGVAKADWYRELESDPSGVSIQHNFVPPVSSSKDQFAYALKVRDIYRWKTDGYIIATIDKAILKDLLRGTSFENNGFMLVLTEDGEVAYNSDPSLFRSTSEIEQFLGQLGHNDSYVMDNNRDFYYSSWKSKATGWNFIIFADKRHAKMQIFNFQVSVLLVAVLTIFLLIVVARLTAKAYIKPINQLIDFIHKVEKNEFAGQIDLKSDDEMGDLVDSFNAMIASVRQNQVLRKKAQIYALQKQINPHFLFNTFESIKALAQQNDTRGVVSMIEKLSDIFHYNTNRGGTSMTKICDEVSHIKNYLDIQRVRFGTRMEVSYDIDPEILSYWMPRVILQPIVENSVSHSLEQMKGGYQLDIQGGFDGEDIVFIIRDNGVGIPEEKLAMLQEYIFDMEGAVKTSDFGIGLKNIQERLYLLYGEGYGLTINSVFGEYTEVRVRIPKIENRQEEKL